MATVSPFPTCLGIILGIDFAAGDPQLSKGVLTRNLSSSSLLAPLEVSVPALVFSLGLAEFLQHSNIHISTAEYELCTISSEKEFNDASLVQSAATNEE